MQIAMHGHAIGHPFSKMCVNELQITFAQCR